MRPMLISACRCHQALYTRTVRSTAHPLQHRPTCPVPSFS